MATIKVGVIGIGSISQLHLDAYAAHPEVDIYAVCDLNQERANRAAKRYGARRVFTDYNELLATKEIDAVSICTWNNTHAEISIAAVRAGKHVLVEKPLCKTVEEAIQVLQAVRGTENIFQVGFVRRYDPNAQMIYDWIKKGELGEIYYAKATALRRAGNPGGWFANEALSGGGPLIDLGVHMIDLCWYMMGRPKVKAVSGNTYKKLGNRSNVKHLSAYRAADYDPDHNTVEDMANAMIRFENGASLLVDVSFSLHLKQDESAVQLFGTKGGIEIDPEVVLVKEMYDTIIHVHPQTNHSSFQFKLAFEAEIAHFIDCIQTGKEPLSPVEDGVELMKILCSIYESAKTGKEITL